MDIIFESEPTDAYDGYAAKETTPPSSLDQLIQNQQGLTRHNLARESEADITIALGVKAPVDSPPSARDPLYAFAGTKLILGRHHRILARGVARGAGGG